MKPAIALFAAQQLNDLQELQRDFGRSPGRRRRHRVAARQRALRTLRALHLPTQRRTSPDAEPALASSYASNSG